MALSGRLSAVTGVSMQAIQSLVELQTSVVEAEQQDVGKALLPLSAHLSLPCSLRAVLSNSAGTCLAGLLILAIRPMEWTRRAKKSSERLAMPNSASGFTTLTEIYKQGELKNVNDARCKADAAINGRVSLILGALPIPNPPQYHTMSALDGKLRLIAWDTW
jgi:hypothetical protein